MLIASYFVGIFIKLELQVASDKRDDVEFLALSLIGNNNSVIYFQVLQGICFKKGIFGFFNIPEI